MAHYQRTPQQQKDGRPRCSNVLQGETQLQRNPKKILGFLELSSIAQELRIPNDWPLLHNVCGSPAKFVVVSKGWFSWANPARRLLNRCRYQLNVWARLQIQTKVRRQDRLILHQLRIFEGTSMPTLNIIGFASVPDSGVLTVFCKHSHWRAGSSKIPNDTQSFGKAFAGIMTMKYTSLQTPIRIVHLSWTELDRLIKRPAIDAIMGDM